MLPSLLWNSTQRIQMRRYFSSLSNSLIGLKNCFTPLQRSIIKIEGVDSIKFIQGLTTNDVTLFQHDPKKHQNDGEESLQKLPVTSLFTMLLNHQGRILFDAFIYKRQESLLIDVDSRIIQDALSHFKKYKLRSKLTITDVSNQFRVWSIFGTDVSKFSEDPSNPISKNAYWDSRCKNLGMRVLLPPDKELQTPTSFKQVSSSEYHAFRILNGVAEGPEELIIGQGLPFECLLDDMNGVSYKKGCYLGQELTARTHYQGVIRKRLLPLALVDKEAKETNSLSGNSIFPPIVQKNQNFPPINSEILTMDGKKAGTIHSSVYNVGMAMIRLEYLEKEMENTIFTTEGGLKLCALKPFWWNNYLKTKEQNEQMIASQFSKS